MKIVRSYVRGAWHQASSGLVPLVDPSTEEEIAQVSSAGIDFSEVLAHARTTGGPVLRALSYAERGQMLKAISKALREHRDELLDLSRRNAGTTEADGSFDIDGASGTLAYYGSLAKRLGSGSLRAIGDGVQLARTEALWGQHVTCPRPGVAVHINAFNFPAWGFAEKAACALLAGMPVITKPATATALVTERCLEIAIDTGALPEGALQLICGSTGDLLDHLGPDDVLAFTGSADTADTLRLRPAVQQARVRVNVEADSLNAAVLGPDVEPGSAAWKLFVKDVAREMTQKTGQKCTAVRRILAPTARLDDVQEALIARLGRTVTGNPADAEVTMGPLTTAHQLTDATLGVEELATEARLVLGNGARIDGASNPAGKGYFFAPTLLRADSADGGAVHQREVFGPVATLLPISGEPAEAAAVVARGGGTLVTSVYSDDRDWIADLIRHGGASTGRLYIGSEGSAPAAFGSGSALPQLLHGGPGRAGGGEELGGLIGLELYQQRLALQGEKSLVESLAGITEEE